MERCLGSGSTLIVAVSGGGDSVALLHGLALLREPLSLNLVAAHLDHALRPESAQDAAFVGNLCLDLSIQCLRERRDVAAVATQQGRNLEEVARQERYEMLESAARAVHADAIALAHTANDQAETMLMHLLRGAGLDGLKGMTMLAPSPLRRASTPLFRPLLPVHRETLRAWLRTEGHSWREDATNEDTERTRSRLRHRVIPLLEQEQPNLISHLSTTARLLADEHAWLEAETELAWQQLAHLHNNAIRFQRVAFLAQPRALQRRLLRRAFFYLQTEARDLSFEQVENALDIAEEGGSGARATLPGHLFLIAEADTLWVGQEPDYSDTFLLTESITLPEQGTCEVDRWRIVLEEVGREVIPDKWHTIPSHVALLDRDSLALPLRLRPPQPGDRWAPLGMGGQRVELRDWLAKHKVPLTTREQIPLLVDANGRILWIVGEQVGHEARVRPSSDNLLQLTVHAPLDF